MRKFQEKQSFLVICILLCIITTSSVAQAPSILWTKTYGGADDDQALAVQQTTDGGYIVSGLTRSFGAGHRDVWLIKTDANGDTIWAKTYGGEREDLGASVQQTIDGGYIVTGWTSSFSAGKTDIWLIKTDANGDTLWTKNYGGPKHERAFSIQQTTDGGYIVAGYTGSFSGGFWVNVWLIKTDANGDTLWTKIYGGPTWSIGRSVRQTSDGGYIIVGWQDTGQYPNRQDDVYLLKTDYQGKIIWERTYGWYWNDYGNSVQQTSDGGYIIAGHISKWPHSVWLVKTNKSGDTLWTKTFEGYCGNSVQQTTDGGYIITGEGDIDSEYRCLFLLKADSTGNPVWMKVQKGAEKGHLVQQTADGGYIVAGSADRDVFLMKVAGEVVISTSDIDPNMLNLKSHGQWITCYIELPEDYCAEDIDINTIALTAIDNESIDPPLYREGPTDIGDYDEDGIADLMVKFNRKNLIGILIEKIEPPADVELTVSGELSDDTPFEGSDIIHVIHPGGPQNAEQENLPYTFTLYGNYPNPFSSNTDIRYALPTDAQVKLDIYDVSGRVVKTLGNDMIKAGYYVVSWGGSDEKGMELPSGVYFLKFEAGDHRETKKLILLR